MKIFHSSYPVEIGTEGIEPSSSGYICHKISSVQNRYTCTAPIRKEAKIMKKNHFSQYSRASWIRTNECSSQSAVPCRLAIALY